MLTEITLKGKRLIANPNKQLSQCNFLAFVFRGTSQNEWAHDRPSSVHKDLLLENKNSQALEELKLTRN